MSFKKTIRRKTKAPDLEYFRLGAIAYMGYPKIADRSAGLGYPRIGCYNDLFGISQGQQTICRNGISQYNQHVGYPKMPFSLELLEAKGWPSIREGTNLNFTRPLKD